MTAVGTHNADASEAQGPGPAVACHNGETVARAERDLYLARLKQAEAEQLRLKAELSEALEQIEHWRTLAEYREKRLVERPG